MEFLRRNPLVTLIGGGAIALVAVIAVTLNAFQSDTNKKTNQDPQAVSSFYSPLTQSSDSLAINYGGSAEPNRDAVIGRLRIFSLDSLPLPQTLKDKLPAYLQATLPNQVSLSYEPTFIQITRSSIKCPTEFDCSFSFYLDSPERYFTFHTFYQANGAGVYTLAPEPFPGVAQ